MESFHKFYQILENYKDIERSLEAERISSLNMTSRLPMPKDGDILKHIRGLTRGFHLNTIVNRIFQPWIQGLEFAPARWDLYEKSNEKKDVYKWRISENDKRANNQYKAAYSLFKQEIANAVNSLPEKTGFNIISQSPQDVMMATKQFLKDVQAEEADLIESMQKAYNIFTSVFGPRYYNQARNFANFFQIVHDEFMRYKEMLPAMGEDDEMDIADTQYTKAIKKEIEKYLEIERNANVF
jgi:hypothetical protein